MDKVEISILTKSRQETLKSQLGALKWSVHKFLGKSGGGPSAVLRSLINGLKCEGIKYNHNPRNINEIGAYVIVLSNIKALREAIELKKSGKIKRLLAGPNLVLHAFEHDGILASPEIDYCVVPWERIYIPFEEENPGLKGRIRAWPAGVDEKFWQPIKMKKSRDVLVYWKTESEEFIRAIENKLKELGWKPLRVVYGKYNQSEFKKKLSKVKFSVFISKSESQGIALAESWAMDVPTLVWNPKDLVTRGKASFHLSSCPFLDKKTGLEWVTISDFERILKNFDQLSHAFKPRQWVLDNMTDRISAQLLLKLFNSEEGK